MTLTKHRGFSRPDDEQLHVLPCCILDDTDEFGSYEGLQRRVRNGSLEVRTKYFGEENGTFFLQKLLLRIYT